METEIRMVIILGGAGGILSVKGHEGETLVMQEMSCLSILVVIT